jgi:hypothetical protein
MALHAFWVITGAGRVYVGETRCTTAIARNIAVHLKAQHGGAGIEVYRGKDIGRFIFGV